VKRKVAVVIALGLVAAAAAGIALLRTEPREADLLSPALAWTKTTWKNRGHDLPNESLQAKILHRSDSEAFVQVAAASVQHTHFLRLRPTPEWTVEADLHDHFAAYVTQSTKLKDEAPARLAKVLAKRMINPAGIRDLRSASEVLWLDELKRPIANLHTNFLDGAQPWSFTETFILKDGAWTMDGLEGALRYSPGLPH